MKELLKKLINADSTADKGEKDSAAVLGDYFKDLGIDVCIDLWQGSRANLVAQVRSTRQKPALVFVSHLDVVPADPQQWQSAPFLAKEDDGRIFGRGAVDMKGPIAAAAGAIAEIIKSGVELKGDIIFAALAGEETDSCGVHRFMRKFTSENTISLGGVIVTEPTDFRLVTTHKGLLWLAVETKGKSAHSSMPQLGLNAIDSMTEFIVEIHDYDIGGKNDSFLGRQTLSVNKITGGSAANIVPDLCRTEIDIRLLPGSSGKDIVSDFKNICRQIKNRNSRFEAEIKILRQSPALSTDPRSDFVKRLLKTLKIEKASAAAFTTDSPYAAPLGVAVVFGPGNPQLCHKPDEYIETEDLQKGSAAYKDIIMEFLG